MSANDPNLWGLVANAVAVGAAWIVGEGGRIAVAGGAGGLARWYSSERRRVRDGVIAVGGGLIVGTYLWPFTLAVIGLPFGGLAETPNNIAMAAFVAGSLGMSIVKVITAMVEARISAGGKDDA